MSGERLRTVAAAALVIGAVLGMAGSFAPSAELRRLAWAADGIALVVGSALLAVHHLRQGHDELAAGFLVFLAVTLCGWAWAHVRSSPMRGAAA